MRHHPSKWGTMSDTAALFCQRHFSRFIFAVTLGAIAATDAGAASAAPICDGRNVMHASVAAFDQPMMINRLGTNRPQGMIYALLGDVVKIDASRALGAGNV